MLRANVKFVFYQILIDGENEYAVPIKTMYSIEWSQSSDFITSVKLEDYIKFFRETQAPNLLIGYKNPLKSSLAIRMLLDNIAPSGGSSAVVITNGAEVDITLGVGTHANVAALAAEIVALLPSNMSCVADGDSIIISHDVDADANEKGSGKSFEIIDSTPGDLAVLGLSAGLVVSSQEPEIELSVKRQDTNTNESYAIKSEVSLQIGYEGTSASLSISNGVLTTTVVGGIGSNLSINLEQISTMGDLAAFINSQPGYSASSIANSNNLKPTRLDEVSAVGIASTGAVKPGRIKRAAYNFSLKISESSVVDFEFEASQGLPEETATAIYLAGGAKGSTTAADIVNAIPALEGIKVN
jgi:hypothetical protein